MRKLGNRDGDNVMFTSCDCRLAIIIIYVMDDDVTVVVKRCREWGPPSEAEKRARLGRPDSNNSRTTLKSYRLIADK